MLYKYTPPGKKVSIYGEEKDNQLFSVVKRRREGISGR